MSGGSWTDDRDRYFTLVRRHAPHAVLMTKDHAFWTWIGRLLWLATGGRMTVDAFLSQYATTIGPIQAYPRSWPRLPESLLVHESRHTWQCQRLGWLVPLFGWLGVRMRTWAGLLPMGALYLLVPLPAGLCYGRMMLELDAEAASWRTSLSEGWLSRDAVRKQARFMADRVSGPDYVWSWPRAWTRQRFSKRAEEVIAQWEADPITDNPDI